MLKSVTRVRTPPVEVGVVLTVLRYSVGTRKGNALALHPDKYMTMLHTDSRTPDLEHGHRNAEEEERIPSGTQEQFVRVFPSQKC